MAPSITKAKLAVFGGADRRHATQRQGQRRKDAVEAGDDDVPDDRRQGRRPTDVRLVAEALHAQALVSAAAGACDEAMATASGLCGSSTSHPRGDGWPPRGPGARATWRRTGCSGLDDDLAGPRRRRPLIDYPAAAQRHTDPPESADVGGGVTVDHDEIALEPRRDPTRARRRTEAVSRGRCERGENLGERE